MRRSNLTRLGAPADQRAATRRRARAPAGRPRGSAGSSPTTWRRRLGRPAAAGTTPVGPTSRSPWTRPPVFHYGQEIFEGLKAYRQADGSIWPSGRGQRGRFNRPAPWPCPSCPRPLRPRHRALVTQDRDWVPTPATEHSLYLRPFMIATDVGLGVGGRPRPSFAVIASPAGRYFRGGSSRSPCGSGGIHPRRPRRNRRGQVRRQLRRRAVAQRGREHGCEQVVWLDAARAPLGRGNGRDEPLLRVRLGARMRGS